ncbi:hypothetical protein Gotur_005383, partial [Gossypium turneri]
MAQVSLCCCKMMMSLLSKSSTMEVGSLLNLSQIHLSSTLVMPRSSITFLFLFILVQIQSNGMYKSIEHRVITNEKKARISIAAFMFPDGEQEIGPLETMIDAKTIPDCIETSSM